MCDRHHTLVHEGGWRVARAADGALRFIRPDGREQTASPPQRGATSVADLYAAQAALPLTPDTLRPTWDGAPVDYEWGAAALWGMTAPGG